MGAQEGEMAHGGILSGGSWVSGIQFTTPELSHIGLYSTGPSSHFK